MATLLAHNGVRVRIVDKKAELSRETRAVVVHAKILELLDKLGLTDKALAEGEQLSSAQVMSQGKLVGKFSFRSSDNDKRTPYPFALIYGQDQTEHLLLQSLEEVRVDVVWNTEMLSLEQTANGVQVRIRTVDGNEETIEAQWVIGADGSHSVVRHTLSLGFVGEAYPQALFIADVDIEWVLKAQQGGMDLAREGFFLFVPMHGERRYRLFGTLPPELAHRHTVTLDDVRHVFDTQSGLHVNILRANWISVYHTYLRMAERFRVGRVFLLGDAAHIHSPAGGQGMNTGIGDAFNLAWKLALVVKGQAQETLLDSYEAERVPFARSILRGSDAGFQLMTATNPVLRWLKLYVIAPLFGRLLPLPPFKRSFFWLLSQLWTSYRNSPAVTNGGHVKRGPRAGDRAPYGFFEAGPDAGKSIFTLLKGQDHRLLLFAGSKPANPLTNFQRLEEHVRSLLDAYAAPISLHVVSSGNRKLHKLYGAEEPSLFLVRPDGHIAYRGDAEDLDSFKLYLDKLFTQQRSLVQSDITFLQSV
jgi:2-polyprenyl-6-methoxyphenol hydroxylase-like FAD-dependent oxidoreductase